MGQYQIQRWGSSPLIETAQTKLTMTSNESSSSSSPSSIRISRLNNLDPVPEDSSLGRKRSMRTHQAQLEIERLRASKRRSDANSARSFSFEEDARSRISGLAPPPLPSSRSTGKMPTRYLVGSSSSSIFSGQTTPGGRPMRALSGAQETLERERRRVEMIGKRPDWVIDLDVLEDGMKVWTKPRASRVILFLGGESERCFC